jgi:hypothetical protein
MAVDYSELSHMWVKYIHICNNGFESALNEY